MLYDRPIYRPLGDMFVDVEFGDELHLALNFRVIGLNLSLAARPPAVARFGSVDVGLRVVA